MTSGQVLSRRGFLKITAALGMGGLAAAYGLSRTDALQPVTVSESRFLLGTVINLTVIAPGREVGHTAIGRTFAEIERLSKICSRFDPNSQLSQLNRTGVLWQPAAELMQIMRAALNWGAVTQGAFDLTIKPVLDLYQRAEDAGGPLPLTRAVDQALELVDYRQIYWDNTQVRLAKPGMSITLDGIAKGFIIDAAVSVLKEAGFEHVLVEAGGDLFARGKAEGGRSWRVGVRDPRVPDSTLTSFPLSQLAAATSGDYEQAFTADRRLNHLIDPRTGQSPSELSSVTIIAPSAMDADALATAVSVMGSAAGLKLIDGLPQVEAYLVTKEGRVIHSPDFPI